MTANEIRQAFLDFFASKQHKIVPSAPIVIKNDPTLLFTNAGMNQFKDNFLGNRKAEFPRVADTQKCLRVSGKHNDLEEVGVDTYHHTMFEMLGNWSFGDYFKKEAIEWSWQLLTEIYNIPKDRLYVSVFEGDEKEKLPTDTEAITEWKKWIDGDRILSFGKKDNFWEMGDTGPCGPCTEIHVDCRSEEERKQTDGKALVNADHPQVIEIWNNVFIQYNRLKNGSLEPLPSRHVDTGMGLERLVRVLQGKQSNYDTDIFTGIIRATETITGKKYNHSETRPDVAFRVLADHLRAISFTIADGQLPSNTGAGYVIRRVLRRAVRYYYTYLDYKQTLLHRLVPVLAEEFKNVFPELQQQVEFVTKVVKEEEDAFLKTLDKGLKKMDDIISQSKKTASAAINGPAAFELFDTYGFPFDLTKLIAGENGLAVDEAGFEKEMLQQKQRSRSATAMDTGDWVILDEKAFSEFVGYDSLEIKSKVVKYRKVNAKGKDAYQLVLEATPFYAESGGQVGDKGTLSFADEIVEVFDTKKENNLHIHFTNSLPKNMNVPVVARVEVTGRKAIAIHHSATHLLHAALRKVLGNHVAQKGSLVNADYLRFDFSHFSKVSDNELREVEKLVNEKIRENIPVIIREMPKEEAMKSGAMALFGEKYGDLVRVVIIDPNYSVELCGGTHAGATGDLGFFKISHETAVASGIRRIEAVCGHAAELHILEQVMVLNSLKETLKNPKDLAKTIEAIQLENAELKKKIESLEARQLIIIKEELLQQVENIHDIQFIGKRVDVSNPDNLKKLCFELKPGLQNFVIVLVANIEGKAHVAIAIAESLVATQKWEAQKLIKEQVAPLIKGGGGGQSTLATAGGQDPSNLEKVIEAIRSLLVREDKH
ncbi:MAG: alanyl-tRNA synthetase [Chitinophagaceae bacterium]|nr:alanyl-tRNA synthetase [Chitinophagaceae bacterium]